MKELNVAEKNLLELIRYYYHVVSPLNLNSTQPYMFLNFSPGGVVELVVMGLDGNEWAEFSAELPLTTKNLEDFKSAIKLAVVFT